MFSPRDASASDFLSIPQKAAATRLWLRPHWSTSFQARPWDGLWVAVAAVLVSFLATVYPAHSATRIAPAEVLRYE